MNKELEIIGPCPWCGGRGEVDGVVSFWIECQECEATGPGAPTKREAIVKWNRASGRFAPVCELAVAWGGTVHALNDSLEKMVGQGWRPRGALIVKREHPGLSGFYQMMVRP